MNSSPAETETAEKKKMESIRSYYGKVLSSSADLKTSACCSIETLPRHVAAVLKDVHPEVKDRFYGCGSPFPLTLDGRTVVDLGCGSGRDVFLLSRLVGPNGQVIGVDMTDEQLSVAEKHTAYHMDKFGYAKSNVRFIKGYIEDLEGAGIEPSSVDLVVSNCVMNLSPDKLRLFSQLWQALRPGGELYFSDVFADRRVPASLRADPILLGECLAGAMYKEDFRRLMLDLGCRDFRVMSTSPITLNDPEVIRQIGMVRFQSVTLRAFKLDLEDKCEDYGQVAYYLGSIPESPHQFVLDDHHLFETGKPVPVCGNTADMLTKTAYGSHFRVVGQKETHFGLFDCGPADTFGGTNVQPGTGACC